MMTSDSRPRRSLQLTCTCEQAMSLLNVPAGSNSRIPPCNSFLQVLTFNQLMGDLRDTAALEQ
jgi:hypothetical protein